MVQSNANKEDKEVEKFILEVEPEKAVKLIDRMARFIAERRMAAAAIMTIESLRPLNNIGAQVMYFLAPFAEVFFNSRDYQEFAVILQDNKYISLLVKRLDELDNELYREEREKRRLLRKRRNNKIKQFFGFKSINKTNKK